MTSRLSRFHDAQAGGVHERVLAELRAGAKRGHWIWFVLPQLAGLGRSSTSRHYALADVAEARDYLRDPILRERHVEVVEAIRAQVVDRGVSIVRLFGGELDAMKCVSSLTLFEGVGDAEPASACAGVLDAAEAQGLPRCAFTKERLDEERG